MNSVKCEGFGGRVGIWLAVLVTWSGGWSPDARGAGVLPWQTQRQYEAAFAQNRVSASGLIHWLQDALSDHEYVVLAIGTEPVGGATGIPVRAVRVKAMDAEVAPSDICCSIITFTLHWDRLLKIIADNAERLWQTNVGEPESVDAPPLMLLVFHSGSEKVLDTGSVRIRLSGRAQRYLVLAAESDYPCVRKVLIISEPHFETEEQVALVRGLGILFDDNPALSQDGRVAFLAEGYPANKALSVRPLVQADSSPNDAMIRRVLDTFLIPGYVAYEWRYQWGIPIIGTEDPVLYRSSARLWCEIQDEVGPGRLVEWSGTVAARNACMARTLVSRMGLHACPFLFVGGMHLGPAQPADDMAEVAGGLAVGEVGRLRSAGLKGIVELLRERGIGYYFLMTHAPVMGNAMKDVERAQRYAALFRAQLQGQVDSYVSEISWPRGGVTVTPCPEAAAQFVAASGSGSNEASSGEGGNDGDDNQDPDPKGLLDRLINALKKVLGKGGLKGGSRSGDLPANGKPNSTDVVDRGDGKGTIRDYGTDGKAKVDYDFGHDHGAGDPHAHDWDWSQTSPRQPGRPLGPGE